MAAFTKTSNARIYISPSISPVKNKAMTLLDIVREEGKRLEEEHCGFKYLMAHIGTIEDFKDGRIPFIRRKQLDGVEASYGELCAMGKTDEEIRALFAKFFSRAYVIKNDVADPPQELVQEEWLSFKNSPYLRKIKGGGHPGGKVTYAELVAEGKSEDQIEKIFNTSRRKYEAMEKGSYRCKMYEELQKMLTNFNPNEYYSGKRAASLSPHIEKHSNCPQPPKPTTFCQAVARMMTLVRFSHQESGADERNWKAEQYKIQKKIANNKRCAKYNALQSQMGVDKFNQMKVRDQAAKEERAAHKIYREGMTDRTAKFVKWRTETPAGRKYDTFPTKMYVTPLYNHTDFHIPTHTKHLGYTNHLGLANVVRRCLDNTRKYTNIFIKFTPDPGDASSQVYQYAPISGQRPAQLRKTRDADTARTFRVCGMLKVGAREYYIQPDQKNGVPMKGNVYYSLPTEWRDYEQWSGFGVMGNPQKSTSMETLFKIVDNNITEVSFITGGKRYHVRHSRYNPITVDHIFNSIVNIPTPAESAAAAAEVEKKCRAQKARAKEAVRQKKKAAKQCNTKRSPTRIFEHFYGVGTKQEDSTSQAKVNLAIKLAQGDIDQTTFNTAMDALN